MRPTFYLHDDQSHPIRAGGILFYKYSKDIADFELLMIKSRGQFEDFGGCTDSVDSDIIDTVTREVEEESNCVFKREELREKLQGIEPVYVKYCKYALYCVELTQHYDPELFGDVELHDNISRTVEWIPYETFNKPEFIKKLHFRLNQQNILDHLKILLCIDQFL